MLGHLSLGRYTDNTVDFAGTSSGQVALVMYEWKDVPYLGAMTPDEGVGRPAHPVRFTPHPLPFITGLSTPIHVARHTLH